MTSNPLDPSTLLQGMADALSTKADGDTTSSLSSSHEALALFTHACMASLGFRLLGFDQDKLDEPNCRESAPRLPENWNASFNSYSFVYAHKQSALRFVTKIDRIGGKSEIRGLAVEDDRIARVEITTKDFVSNGSLPVRFTRANAQDGAEVEDRSDLPQKLLNVFISEGRIKDLASSIKVNIIQKLLPSLQKEGYEESPDDRAAREDADSTGRRPPRQPPQPGVPDPRPAQPYPFHDPLNPRPRGPDPLPEPIPGWDDELDLHRRLGGRLPGRLGDYGRSDIDPQPILGPPGGPFGGPRPPFGPGGGGMHPTPESILGNGGVEYDPRAPPGARVDPLDPFDPSGLPRPGGPRGGGNDSFGGGFGGGFGNHFI